MAFKSAVDAGEGSRIYVMEAAQRWAREDFVGLLHHVASTQLNRDSRSAVAVALGQHLAPDYYRQLDLMISYLGESELVGTALQSALHTMAFDDALALCQYFLSVANHSEGMSQFANGLFKISPDETLNHFLDYPAEERARIYSTFAFTYAREKPSEALNWAMGLDASMASTKQMVFASMAASGTGDLESLFLSQPEGTLNRRLLFREVANKKGRDDPLATLAWLTQHASEPGYGLLVEPTFRRWIQQDPWAAGEQIKSTMPTDKPLPIMRHLLQAMIRGDMTKTDLFVHSLPESIGKQQGIAGLAVARAADGPEQAWLSMAAVTDPAVRNEAAWQIANTWAAQKPMRTDEIGEMLELTEDQRVRLHDRYLGRE